MNLETVLQSEVNLHILIWSQNLGPICRIAPMTHGNVEQDVGVGEYYLGQVLGLIVSLYSNKLTCDFYVSTECSISRRFPIILIN
jgi:hypothetical protein